MTFIDPFAAPDEIRSRIERLVRGERLAAPTLAGAIPAYYGGLTAAEISERWVMLSRSCAAVDREFYLAGAVGWASR